MPPNRDTPGTSLNQTHATERGTGGTKPVGSTGMPGAHRHPPPFAFIMSSHRLPGPDARIGRVSRRVDAQRGSPPPRFPRISPITRIAPWGRIPHPRTNGLSVSQDVAERTGFEHPTTSPGPKARLTGVFVGQPSIRAWRRSCSGAAGHPALSTTVLA